MGREPRAGGGTVVWGRPLAILTGLAAGIFGLAAGLDTLLDPTRQKPWELLLFPDPATALSTLSTAAQVVAGALAIVITVVAIVVELAATRYTHRITDLFLAEPTNRRVFALFVTTTILCLWVSWTYTGPVQAGERPPTVAIALTLVLVTVCLVVLLPYFAFVFAFLTPERVIQRIARRALRAVHEAAEDDDWNERQQAVVSGIDQLTDIGLGAIANRDRSIAIEAVDALHDFLLEYEQVADRLPAAWFSFDHGLAEDPDFVAMTETLRESVERRRLWVELKIVRQYLALLNGTLGVVREVNHAILLRARSAGRRALETSRPELFDVVLRFFNSCLRAAINAGDVRTAYYVVHQYRRLAEHALEAGEPARAITAAEYLRYYGLVSHTQGVRLVLETVAYDVSILIEHASAGSSEALDALLRVFLQIDKEGDSELQERTLRGVRKAQVRLATWFLARGDAERARRIFADMAREEPARLASIRAELTRDEAAEYWEITDREENFSYLPPPQRARIPEFFSWFETRPDASPGGA